MRKQQLIQPVFMALLLLVGAPAASGQESFRDRQIDARFAAADKNQDGKLTLEEAQAGMPKVAANFDKIDTQKRGYVTLDQIKAAAAR
jgi:Ca2+-binding EF-hand superfamily protein